MSNNKGYFFFCCFLFFLGINLKSQTNVTEENKFEIKGVVLDEENKEPIVGAIVSYEGGKGVETDTEGAFKVFLPSGNYTLKVTYIGYSPITQGVKVQNQSKTVNFKIVSSSNLKEVEVVADIAKVRETPIAVSNISGKQIKEELGSRDLPMILNSTPGVYATQQGGGAGDARVNIRGFDQRNIAVLVDGVPVNDMENGQVYWSNWSGLSEVTKLMQVQRGLGASRLAVPSVGGMMNIITSSIDDKRSFVVKNDMGTNNYQRFAVGYNSGILKGKFGVTLSGSYTTGDGWVDKTWQKAWSYFAKIMYRINSRNLIVLGVNGAPQSHAQRTSLVNMAFYDRAFAIKQGINADSIYSSKNNYTNGNTSARGLQYNPDWGTVNGKVVNAKVNYFHKPLFNLSYFSTINSKLFFSNVLYVSMGRGGGTSIANGPSYLKDGSGQLDLQLTYNTNYNAAIPPPSALVPGLKQTSSYIYASVNNHNWVGTLSTFKYHLNDKLSFTGGLDARYYNGIHYQTPVNLFGADYVQQPIGKDLSLQPITKNPSSYIAKPGDKINYYYQSKVTWAGLFAQGEYKINKLSVFVTITGNQTSYQNINYFGKKDIVIDKKNIIHNVVGYGDTLYTDGQNYGVRSNPYALPNTNTIAINGDGSISFKDVLTNKTVTVGSNYSTFNNTSSQARVNTTKIKYYTGYTTKGGLNYNLNSNNNVFANLGYMSLTPRYSNVFNSSGVEVKDVKNQLIKSFEVGYGVRYPFFAANINGYLTQWDNKPLDFPISKPDPQTGNLNYFNIAGINALMKGIELDLSANILPSLSVQAFGMLADWRWISGAKAYLFSDSGTPLDSLDFNAKNVHIGNAPQQQLGGSIRFEAFKGFYIKPQYIYFNKIYSQFDPSALAVTKATDFRNKESWRMPGYGTLNLFIGYAIRHNTTIVNITASMTNVLGITYLTDSSFSSGTNPNNYNPLYSLGYMGQGRIINIGTKVTF